MKRGLARALACGTLVAAGAIFGGCGGGTETVTATGASRAGETAPSASASSTSTPRTTTSTRTRTATSTTTTPAPGATGSSTTHTAPEPAFSQHAGTGAAETTGAEMATAVAAVKARGYTPNNTAEYRPDQTLRVLTATRTGSADGYAQRAFFFVGGKYIGTDASAPSASVRVVSQSDTEVVLAYPLYRPHDPLCCPGGGEATVHFQLNNGRLVPLQPIPPASSASGVSRQ